MVFLVLRSGILAYLESTGNATFASDGGGTKVVSAIVAICLMHLLKVP